MEYKSLTKEDQIMQVETQIRELERQHFSNTEQRAAQLTISKAGSPEIVSYDTMLAGIEARLTYYHKRVTELENKPPKV